MPSNIYVILRRSFTRPSTVLAVIEGLGTRLKTNQNLVCVEQTETAMEWTGAHPECKVQFMFVLPLMAN